MIQINLLPVREERRKAGLRQLAILLTSAFVGSLLLVGAVHWKQSSDLDKAKKALAATQVEIDGYKEQLAQMEKLKKTEARIQQKLGVIDRLEAGRLGPVRMFEELAIHTPERVWITHMSSQNGALSLEGKSLDNELVASFLTALGDSPVFDNVELVGTKSVEVEGLRLSEFRVTATIRAPEPAGAAQQTASNESFTPPVAGR